jgi:uncharacterized damage-inducible protein DinB
VFIHIANGNHLLLNVAGGADKAALDKEIDENEKGEKAALNKDGVVALLTESFAAVRKAMGDATAGALSRDADFFGRKTTMRGVLAELDTHIAEHMGQAIAYARVNGIVPPWSK